MDVDPQPAELREQGLPSQTCDGSDSSPPAASPAPAAATDGLVADYGLRSVELADAALIGRYFGSLRTPLSDYTFSQLYSWRNSLRILWRELDGHLCVFANGTGDLTLLVPPIGEGDSDRALRRCWEVMDDYNASHRVPDRSRVEYASEELLARFERSKVDVTPMGTDYVYDVNRMIDLAGGDLASKRQAKNRFLRNYKSRVEIYDAARHLQGCMDLLAEWKEHQDASHASDKPESASALKRQKESLATRLSLQHAGELGYRGMVVYVEKADGSGESIRGFTFGEALGSDASSIVIEKTDLEAKGLAQFIFSEFCRTEWADRPMVNVGDDWGLETLAWTKMSYRPVKLLQKYSFAKPARIMSAPTPQVAEVEAKPIPFPVQAAAEAPKALPITIRPARKADVAAAVSLEQECFTTYSLKKRQLQYLQARPSSVFLVAEQGGQVVGDCIALVRHHKKGISGRIYSLAVSEQCRGQKIGKQLMARLMEEMAARGVRKAYLEVEQTNAKAVGLYESLGFRNAGPLEDYYGEGRHGWHMVAELPAQPNLFTANVA